jgi:hypothetical protein
MPANELILLLDKSNETKPGGNTTPVNDRKQKGGYSVNQSVMFMYGGCVNLQSNVYRGVNKDKEIGKIFYQENSLEEPIKPKQTGGSIRRKNTTDDKHKQNGISRHITVEEPKEQKKVNISRHTTVEEPNKRRQKGGNIQTNLVSLIPSKLRDLSEENYSNYNNELLRLKAIYYSNQYKN